MAIKTCVSSYSFGSYVREAKLGILGVIRKAAEMGFDGIEFVEGDWMQLPDIEAKIRETCAECGIAPVSFCVGADFINGSGGDLDAEVERLCKRVDFAAAIGVPNMRHDVTSGIYGRKYSIGYDDALPTLVKGIRRVADYAASVGVGTMTENHGYFSQDANRVEKLINSVAHPNFGALVDIGNFMCADEDPTLSVAIMAPYAKHVHAKDFHYRSGSDVDPGRGWFRTRAGNYLRGSVLGHGEAHAAQSLGIIKRSGYDGYISIEFEGMEDNLLALEIGLENLKRFLG